MDTKGKRLMNRKHTLLIAVLINACLLTLLFVTAVTQDRPDTEKIVSIPPLTPDQVQLISPGEEKIESKEIPSLATKEEEPVMPPILHKLPPIAPPAAKEWESPPQEGGITIQVQPGDSLDKLAKMYHCTISEILEWNHLSSTHLRVGQSLKIFPKKPKKVGKQTAASSPAKEEKAVYYIVKSGDNPWTIAMKHHIKVEELLRLNQLDEKKAKHLKPGDKLRIR